MHNSILLVEDDKLVRETIVSILTDDGYDVTSVSTAEKAKEILKAEKFDAILLDIQLPDGSGLRLINTIRDTTDVPVIIISGRTDTVDKVIGLEMGADDYISKPLELKEMIARIRAQTRRYKGLSDKTKTLAQPPQRISFEGYILDRAQMQVFEKTGKNIGLTTREYKLIEALVMAPKQVHTREQLLNKVRSDNFDVTDRSVDVQLLRIRRKLKDNINTETPLVKSVRGVGYMLNCIPVLLD